MTDATHSTHERNFSAVSFPTSPRYEMIRDGKSAAKSPYRAHTPLGAVFSNFAENAHEDYKVVAAESLGTQTGLIK